MATSDASGVPASTTGGLANQGLDAAAGAVSSAGARQARTLDDRLTLIAIRMTYVSLSFFFACFYFAIFYLQLINSNGLWLPKGVDHPPTWMGVVETGLVLLAGLVYFGGQWLGLYERLFGRLQLALWIAALLTLGAVVVHFIELHIPGFSLQAGGYVSCFVIIEAMFTALLVVCTIVLLGMANRARLGLFRESGIAIETFGEFFGWTAAVALINFLALYVQPFFPIA